LETVLALSVGLLVGYAAASGKLKVIAVTNGP
jgi:hypothetical protein